LISDEAKKDHSGTPKWALHKLIEKTDSQTAKILAEAFGE
jgi:hypothetical protein